VRSSYFSATSTSGSSPNVAEKWIFGALSVRPSYGEERAAYGLGFRERSFHAVDCVVSRGSLQPTTTLEDEVERDGHHQHHLSMPSPRMLLRSEKNSL
jgi:hypothetical protein